MISITGFDAVYAKVSTTLGTLIKDANERASVVASLKESFNEKVLKDQFNKTFPSFLKRSESR